MHKIEVVTVLCSSRAHFGSSPRMTAALGAQQCSVPAPQSLGLVCVPGKWHQLLTETRLAGTFNALSPSVYWLRSFRLTNKYPCKYSKVSFPLQEYCYEPPQKSISPVCCAKSCPGKMLQSMLVVLSYCFVIPVWVQIKMALTGFSWTFYMAKGYIHILISNSFCWCVFKCF